MSLSSLEKLKQQRQHLQARIQALEARHNVAERKKDTRRKILLGAYYLEQASDPQKWKQIQDSMHTYLTRNTDRLLFDLPPLPQ